MRTPTTPYIMESSATGAVVGELIVVVVVVVVVLALPV
jgi:hypothetical protein